MNQLLHLLANHETIQSLLNKESRLGNLGLQEESLLIASMYQKKPDTYVIVKQNIYTCLLYTSRCV